MFQLPERMNCNIRQSETKQKRLWLSLTKALDRVGTLAGYTPLIRLVKCSENETQGADKNVMISGYSTGLEK